MGTSLAIIGPSAAHTSKHAQQSLKRKGGRSEHRHPQSRRSDCACLHARLSESWCLLRRLHAGKSSVPALKERRRGSDTSEAKATHPRQGSLFAFRCQSSFLCRRLSRSQLKTLLVTFCPRSTEDYPSCCLLRSHSGRLIQLIISQLDRHRPPRNTAVVESSRAPDSHSDAQKWCK